MLQGIFDLIKKIVDLGATVGSFIVTLIKDLVMLTKLTGRVMVDLPSYVSWLPSSALIIFTATLSVVVLYKIFGRT